MSKDTVSITKWVDQWWNVVDGFSRPVTIYGATGVRSSDGKRHAILNDERNKKDRDRLLMPAAEMIFPNCDIVIDN